MNSSSKASLRSRYAITSLKIFYKRLQILTFKKDQNQTIRIIRSISAIKMNQRANWQSMARTMKKWPLNNRHKVMPKATILSLKATKCTCPRMMETLTLAPISEAKKIRSFPPSSETKFQVFQLVDLIRKRAMGPILTLLCELVSRSNKSFKRLNRWTISRRPSRKQDRFSRRLIESTWTRCWTSQCWTLATRIARNPAL